MAYQVFCFFIFFIVQKQTKNKHFNSFFISIFFTKKFFLVVVRILNIQQLECIVRTYHRYLKFHFYNSPRNIDDRWSFAARKILTHPSHGWIY